MAIDTSKLPTNQEWIANWMRQNPQYDYTVSQQTAQNLATLPKSSQFSNASDYEKALIAAGKDPTFAKEQASSVFSPVSVIRSSDGATAINNNIKAQNADVEALKNKSTTTTTSNSKVEAVGGIKPDEAKSLGIDLTGYKYDSGSGYYIPKTTSDYSADVNNKFEQDKNEIDNFYNGIIGDLDTANAKLVSSIQNVYAQRIAEMQESNRRSLETYKTLGIRGGAGRYAQEIQKGILSEEERQGMDRINKIMVEEASLVAQAQQALVDKKYSVLADKRDKLDALREERNSQLNKLTEKANQALEEEKKAKIQASREGAIAGLITQGITDKAQMLDFLNYYDDGTPTGGNFTAKEIDDVVTKLVKDRNTEQLAGLDTDLRTYEWLKENRPEELKAMGVTSYNGFVRSVAQAKKVTTAESGVDISTEDLRSLVGAGFSTEESKQIISDINKYGLERVLEGITDTAQKTALKKIFNVQEKVTREQIASQTTQKIAQDELQKRYTTDELVKIAKEKGYGRWYLTGKGGELTNFLNSNDALQLYIDLVYQQYKDAGMAD